MNKKIGLVLVLLFCQLVNASISIQPEILNVSVIKNIETSFQMNITNTYGFDIYNLKFYGLEGFTFPEINISSGSTSQVNFNVNTNYSFEGIKTSNVNFKYFGSIPEDITTYILNINSSGINGKPFSHITIRAGDSIKWENHDDVTHNLQSTSFESSIIPTSSYTKQFNELGTFEYRTVVAGITIFTGTIDVINRTGSYLVTNPNYDFDYLINLKSIPNETSLSASISQNNFTIDPTNYKDLLLTITNNGSNKAENIIISSDLDWITPDENNFDLNAGDIKYIKIRVFPEIFETNQTNRTYDLNLKVKAINTNEYSNNLKIFVTYSEEFGDLTSENFLVNWLTNFCKASPNSLLCNNTGNLNETAKVIYRESEFSVNMTGSEWYNLIKIIASMKDTQDRSGSSQNDYNLKTDSKIDNLANQTNQTLELVMKDIKSRNDWSDFKWIIGTFGFVSFGIIFIVYMVRKLNKKKEIVDVYNFEYK